MGRNRNILKIRMFQRKDQCFQQPVVRNMMCHTQVLCPKQVAHSTVAGVPPHRRATWRIDMLARAFLLQGWGGEAGYLSQVEAHCKDTWGPAWSESPWTVFGQPASW